MHYINDNPKYFDFPIPEFKGNPLVEALTPPPKDDDEAIMRLAQRPLFDPSERELPSNFRMLLPARLTRFMFPTSQHVKILKRVYNQILDGYRQRNPLTADGQRLLHDAGDLGHASEPVVESPIHRPSSISFLTGLSGMGKSTLIRFIMSSLGKPVIKHSSYKGTPFPESQILYLMRNVPDQCSAKAMCKSFGDYTDSLLGVKLYSRLFEDKSMTRTHYVAGLRRIIANHHVAALVIDEFQNLSLAKSGGKKELIAMILNLRDELGVPIILVGTYKAADILKGEASVARRLVDGGFHELQRPESPNDEGWQALCEIAWEYQWVKNPQPLKEEIIDVLYDYSQGVTGIMLNLFITAQIEAIESETEVVDAKLLKSVYLQRFKPLHGVIDALRSRDISFMNQYDDLYIKSFSALNEDPLLNRIDNIRTQLMNKQERELGLGVSQDDTNIQSTNSAKPLSRSSEELLRLVQSDCSGVSEVFIQGSE